jgi:hypothetical protein
MSLLVSAGVAALIGIGLLRIAWPASVPLRPYRFLIVALGTALGLGVTSLLLFAWLLVAGSAGRGLIGVELALLALLALWTRRRDSRMPARPVSALPDHPPAERWSRWVTAAFAVTVGCAAAAFIGLSLSQPHGGWDAWMNWNLRARLIYRGGAEWRDAFSALLPWSHPDYPLLVQGSVVRAWVYAGRETLSGPAGVAFQFTFATLALVSAGVAALRGRLQGVLAGVVLLATPFFIFHGASQYGDVPVGLFFLSTVVLLALHDRHRDATGAFAALAGFTAGLAAWTKNEGLLFLLALAVAWAAMGLRDRTLRERGREAWRFAVGLLPMVLVLVFFKLRLAPPNDLMTAAGAGHALDWVRDPRRYALVARAFAGHIVSFGFNGVVSAVGLLFVYTWCVGLRGDAARRTWLLATVATIVLMLAGHGVVFVSAVEDVPRMLDSSLDRLLLQLWPVVVLTWFAVLATPEEAMRRNAGAAS